MYSTEEIFEVVRLEKLRRHLYMKMNFCLLFNKMWYFSTIFPNPQPPFPIEASDHSRLVNYIRIF
jgi:hypothetical protein